MIITELLVVLSVIATKYHGCLPGGIQLCGATAAITGVLILVVLARFVKSVDFSHWIILLAYYNVGTYLPVFHV